MTTEERGRAGAARLARLLAESGRLSDDRLRAAFEAVPRHAFLPERVWVDDPTAPRGFAPVDRGDAPERWWELAYQDVSVTVQLDDGGQAPLDAHWATPTSSASAPGVVARMLAVADLRPGHRVLEIGTGTGYHAALLAQLVGDRSVTTVEIDPAVCARARSALAAAGLRVTVVCADGERGHAERGPYDRIIATTSFPRVPYALVEQTVEDGVILTPWETAFCPYGLARLTVREGRASGHFGTPVTFMTARGQRHRAPIAELFTDRAWQECRHADREADLSHLDDPDARFALGLRLPGVHCWHQRDVGHWLCSDDSWALVTTDAVHQWGPRSLFAELERAHVWWLTAGRPRLHDFGLTVTAEGQWAWLGRPDNVV